MADKETPTKMDNHIETKALISTFGKGEIYKVFPKGGVPSGISVRMNQDLIESIRKQYPFLKSFSDIAQYSIIKQFKENVNELAEYQKNELDIKIVIEGNKLSGLLLKTHKAVSRDLIYPDFALQKKIKNMPKEKGNMIKLILAMRKKVTEKTIQSLFSLSEGMGIPLTDITSPQRECSKCKKTVNVDLIYFEYNLLQQLCPSCYAENYAGTNIMVDIIPNCPCNQNVQTTITMKNRMEFILNYLDKNRLYHINCFKDFAEKIVETKQNESK